MEYPVLILLHVALAIFWAGGAVAVSLFVVPAVLEAGPAGGAVMAGVVKRHFPVLMTVAGGLVVLTGLRLYMIRFTGAWITSPEGIVISLGALLGLGALAIGVFVQKPTTERLAALGAQVAASGAPPSAEQAAEMAALRARMGKMARVIAFHLIGASVLMASHRLAALL